MKAQSTSIHAPCSMLHAQSRKVRSGRRWTAAAAAWILAAGTLLGAFAVPQEARGDYLGGSYILVKKNSESSYTWYNGSGGGNPSFPSDLGTLTALNIGGKVEYQDDAGNQWQSTVKMGYKIDNNSYDYSFTYTGHYTGNNAQWVSGGNWDAPGVFSISISGLSAGSHTLEIWFQATDLNGNTTYDSNDSKNWKTTFTIQKATPPSGGSHDWTGSAITGVASGTGYTLSGTTSATAVGNYTATATLSSGYFWSDGTTAAKSISWSIVAVKPTIGTPTATSITTGGATLGAKVTANGGATITSYGVYCGTSANPTSGGYSNSGAPTTGTAFSKAVTLSAGTLYHYRGFAVNSAGTSYTDDKTFTTLPKAPTITVGAKGTDNIKITVNANGNGTATTYKYYFGTSSSGTPTETCTAGSAFTVDETTDTSAALVPGTKYYVRATATFNSQSATCDAVETSTKPNNPTITHNGSTANSITFTVGANGNGNATTYYYDLYTSNSGTPSTKTCAAGEPVTVTVTSAGAALTENTTYYIRVKAQSSVACDSVVSKSAKTAAGVVAPTITQGAKTIGTTTATLPITVNMGGGATTANITLKYSTTSGSYTTSATVSPLTLAANVTAGAVSGSMSSLSAGTPYYYQWTVANSAGSTTASGSFATEPTAGTVTLTTPAADSLKVTGYRTGGYGMLIVMKKGGAPTWTPSDGTSYTGVTGDKAITAGTEVATGEYVVYNGTGGGTSSGTAVTISGLDSGSQYYVKIYPYSRVSSTASTYNYNTTSPGGANAYTLATEPTWASPSLTATAASTSQINLSWGAATGASGYLIIRKASGTASSSTPTDGAQYSAGDGETLIWITSGSTTSKSDTGLSANTVYSYRIYAYNLVSGQNTTYNYLTTSSATATAKTTAAEPTTQASGLGSSTYSTTGAKLTWTKGNGTYTLVAGAAANTLTAVPTDRTAYTASTTYSSGGQIATGVRTVYTNNSTTVTISGLSANTLYTFGAYSFNGTSDGTTTTYNYKTDTFPTTQFRTTANAPSAAPAISVSSKTDTTMTFSVTKATGSAGTLVEIYTTEALVDPSVRTTYTANLTYGSGTQIGSKGYVVYMGTDSTKSFQVTGLTAGTTYHVRAYAYNGTSSSTAALCSLAYYTAAYGSASGMTLASEPSTQASGLSVTARTASSLTLGWTKGNGTYTLVVAHTADPTTEPTDGTTYTANAAWGSAGALGSYKVVYAGTGAQVQVTGLSAGTRYYFRAYTFNGIGGDSTPPNYKTGSPATANGYTKPNAPTVGATVDGKTMIRLSATKNASGGTTGMVLVYGGSTAPTDGTAVPSVGNTFAGGTVVWTGTANASGIEHVVASGTTHSYRLFSYVSTVWSSAASQSVSTGSFGAEEIVDTFSYVQGSSLNGLNGEHGWSGAWNTGGTTAPTIVPQSGSGIPVFPNYTEYPDNTGNRIKTSLGEVNWQTEATRDFTAVSSGAIYAAAILSYQWEGAKKWAQIGLGNSSGVTIKAGHIWSSSADYHLGIDAYDHKEYSGSFEINPYQWDTDNEYLVILKYEFSTGKISVKGYYHGAAVPEGEPRTWDVTYTVPSGSRPASLSRFGLLAGATDGGAVGDVYFDEVRVAKSWEALLGGTVAVPENIAELTAAADGKELVRVTALAPANARQIVFIAKSGGTLTTLSTTEQALKSGAPGATAGNAEVIAVLDATAGSYCTADHVVATGSQHGYFAYAKNSTEYSPSYTAATGNPVETGSYDASEYLDTFSYTNGTTEASSGNSWKGGQGWGANWWHTDAGTWTAVRPTEIASTVNIAGTIANSTAAGNAVKLTNPGEGGAGTLERTTGGDAWGGEYNNTFYVAFRMAYSWNDPNRWAGLKLIDTTDGSKGVFIGRTMKDDTGASVKHSKLGIEAATSSGGTPSVGSAASGTLYALNDTGGANNAYLVVARVKWTSTAHATVDAWSYKVEGGTPLPTTEPSGNGMAHWEGAYLANVRVIQLQAGSIGTDQIGDVYFDEVRFGSKWEDLLGGVPPEFVWLDGQTTTAYRGDWVTNAVKSRPVGDRQSAQSLLTSSASPAASAFSAAVGATYFGREEGDTVSVWHGLHQITDVSPTPLYGFGAVSGGGTTVYSMDHTADGGAYKKHQYNLSVLPKPAAFSAESGGATKINLTWTPATAGGRTFDEVMVVRFATAGASTQTEAHLHPAQGTAYTVGDTFKYSSFTATVIYRGTGTGFTDTRLTPETTYYYAAYTVNNSYYSEPPSGGGAGRMNANATTAEGSSGTMPEVDGDGSDWTGAPAVAWNSSDTSDNEFVWNDKKGDLRSNTDDCYSADIDEFRVKADGEWVYFLLRLNGNVPAGKSVNLQKAYVSVGVDTRLDAGSTAMNWLGDESGTELGGAYHGTAAERYASRQMAVHYVGGDESTWQIEMFAEDGAQWYAPPTEGWSAAAAGTTDPCVEWRVARADLGLGAAGTAVTTGRFSVATFVNAQGWNQDTKATADIDPGKSAAVDAMEIAPYGENDKDAAMGAWDEGLKDKTVNFWADVGFDKDGVVPNGLPNEPGYAGADTGHGSPTLNWTASTDTDAKGFVTGYLFELAEDSATLNGRDGGTENGSVLYRINLKGADNTSYRPQTTGAEFWWRVRARDNGGQLSAGTIRRFSVEGQKDLDGPKPDLLYVGTNVTRFLDPTDIVDPETGTTYRQEVEASGDALAVVDDVYSQEGTKPTFGFVLQWTDPSGVYATNRSWDTGYTATTRYEARVSQGLGMDGYTLTGGEGAFAWNILGEKGDGSPFGRVSPNWDLMLVDTTHTATFSGPRSWSTSGGYVWKRGASYKKTADTSVESGKGYYTESDGEYTEVANPAGKNPSAEGWYEFLGWTYTKLASAEAGLSSYYKLASGAEPNLQETSIHWKYEEHLELPTEEGETVVTEGWTHVYDKDLPFLPSQTKWDETATPNANLATCITNFVSQAFKLPAYDPDVSLYLTVSAEDGNTYGNGNTVPDGWIDNWYDDTPEGGVSHAHYSADTAESSGSCNDGPAYARNITTNRLIHIPVRDDDSDGPMAATRAWAGADDGTPFAPSLVIATQEVTQAQAQNWATMNTAKKLLPRLEGTGQGVTYQLTDAMLGVPLTFLFNVYDQHITSGLKYGKSATESVKTWTWTNTAFRTRSWNATGYPYSAVESPGAANPQEQGWYVLSGGKYVPAEDAAVQAGTTYYTRSEDGWVTSEENVDDFSPDTSTIKYYNNDSTHHGPGTGDGTILAWNFGGLTEAKLATLFGVPNVLDYIGHHSDGVTNLVQLHAWDCDNDRTGDQAEAEITFGTLMLTDDDATAPTSPGYALLGSGTNYVKFGELASWNWTSSSKPATWSTNAGMKGIDADVLSAWSVGASADSSIESAYTAHGTAPEGEDWSGFSSRFMSVGTGGMKGDTYRADGGAKYFQFDVAGENGTRWTADTLTFDNRVTKDGPTKYTLTVQEAANVTTLSSVTDGQQTAGWTLTGGVFEKAGGIPRFTLENTSAGTASLASPSFTPTANGNAMTRVQYRVGRIGAIKDGATLTVGYRIGDGSLQVLKTHTSSEFADSAASKYANYEVVSFELPISAGDFTVTWEASGINGSQGFLLTDASVVLQNSFNTEHALVEDFVVEKFVKAEDESNQETVKNVVLTWAGAENADGTTWRYRLYAYGADGTGNWGINKVKLHGITMTPRGMDVTDGDLRHATWVNSLEVVDGEKAGWDTEKSGLWLTGDNAPSYVISYPEADAAGRAGSAVASGAFAYKDGKIRKAAYSVLPDGTFEADPTAWTLSGATIGTGSGTRERVLKLAGEDSAVSSAKRTFDVSLGSIAAADVSGVTVSGGFEAKASVAEASGGVNGLSVTVRLKDAGGNVLLAKTFEYAPVAAWRQLEIGPWTADNALVRKAEAEIAQTTAEGTELLVANVALQLATWGAPTGDFANGEPGAKLELQTTEVAAGKTLKLSSELTGEGSKEYVLASTVHDYDRDRTDDALAVTIETGFELHDDDTQEPLLGAKFGGPVGIRLGNRAGSPYNNSGTAVEVVVTDQQMDAAKRDGQTLAYLDIDGYDESGWTTTTLSLDYTEGSAKSLAYSGSDVTAGAAGLPSATNTFHYELATLWANTFVKSQFAAHTANMTVNATLTDQDDDRADDSLSKSSQLGFLKFMDNDTVAPAMRTSGSLKGMFIGTIPESGSMETALSGVSNKDWAAKAQYEVRTLTASDTASERLQLVYDGELCRSAPFYLMANVGDALQSGTGVSISGLQRGNVVSRSIQNGFNDTIAVSNTTMVLSNSVTIVTNLATHFSETYSSAFKTTRAGTATAPQTWYWPTGMTTNEVGFLLPPESASLDFRVLVEAFDSDTNRPGDQAHARLEGPTLRVRDDDTLGPNAPGSPVLWANGAPFVGDSTAQDIRYQVPWTNRTSGLSVHFVGATDKDGTSTGADKALAEDANGLYDLTTSGIGGYWWAAPDADISTTDEATALTLGSDSTDGGVIKKTAHLSVTMDQGYGRYKLFAVDDDADRGGDAAIGTDAGVLLGFDITKPTAVKFGKSSTGTDCHKDGISTDDVDDPTTQFKLTWYAADVGPDDPVGDKTNYDAIPAATRTAATSTPRDVLSPWETYKVYYKEYDHQAVMDNLGPGEEPDEYIWEELMGEGADVTEANGWTCVTKATEIVDPTAGGTEGAPATYTALGSVAADGTGVQTATLYDLDFDREYIVVIRGVDKAGNEGPVTMNSWATNNTIKFAVTQGVVRASAKINDLFGTATDAKLAEIGMQRIATGEGAPKQGAVLYWMAAGQHENPTTHERTGAVTKEYDLIWRDAASFTENGGEWDWALASSGEGKNSGTSQTNWNYQASDFGGLGRHGTGNRMRFFRASYKGRWNPSGDAWPLASEEVYAMNRVPLVEGRNLVALHGVPYTNTFAGVFGTDTSIFPAGDSLANATRVEFCGEQHGPSIDPTEAYYFMQKLENGKVVEGVGQWWSTHLPTPAYSSVTAADANPRAEGWYELSGGDYALSGDTAIVSGKKYYVPSGANYVEVAAGTANPFREGWYVNVAESGSDPVYTPSTDTAMASGTAYYKRNDREKDNPDVTDVVQSANFFSRGFEIVIPDLSDERFAGFRARQTTNGIFDPTRGRDWQYGFDWYPILKVPTTNGTEVTSSEDGTVQGTFSVNVQGGSGKDVRFTLVALNLPVATGPEKMGLVLKDEEGNQTLKDENGNAVGRFHAGDGVSCGDIIYLWDNERGTPRGDGNQMLFYNGTEWRLWPDKPVPADYFQPNDVIVILSRGGASGEKVENWTWTYNPTNFYDLPDRWMGRKPKNP